jgi:hypothetical protein
MEVWEPAIYTLLMTRKEQSLVLCIIWSASLAFCDFSCRIRRIETPHGTNALGKHLSTTICTLTVVYLFRYYWSVIAGVSNSQPPSSNIATKSWKPNIILRGSWFEFKLGTHLPIILVLHSTCFPTRHGFLHTYIFSLLFSVSLARMPGWESHILR